MKKKKSAFKKGFWISIIVVAAALNGLWFWGKGKALEMIPLLQKTAGVTVTGESSLSGYPFSLKLTYENPTFMVAKENLKFLNQLVVKSKETVFSTHIWDPFTVSTCSQDVSATLKGEEKNLITLGTMETKTALSKEGAVQKIYWAGKKVVSMNLSIDALTIHSHAVDGNPTGTIRGEGITLLNEAQKPEAILDKTDISFDLDKNYDPLAWSLKMQGAHFQEGGKDVGSVESLSIAMRNPGKNVSKEEKFGWTTWITFDTADVELKGLSYKHALISVEGVDFKATWRPKEGVTPGPGESIIQGTAELSMKDSHIKMDFESHGDLRGSKEENIHLKTRKIAGVLGLIPSPFNALVEASLKGYQTEDGEYECYAYIKDGQLQETSKNPLTPKAPKK